jgi:hypothetical protein
MKNELFSTLLDSNGCRVRIKMKFPAKLPE